MVDSNSAQQAPPTPQKVEENLPEHGVAYFRMGDGVQLPAFAGIREDQSSHRLSIQLPILQKHPLPKLLLDLLPRWFASGPDRSGQNLTQTARTKLDPGWFWTILGRQVE